MEYGEADFDAFSSTSTQERIECSNCGRKFNPDALNRHMPVCMKNAQKKRKVFDSSKQRAEGTEIPPVKKSAARNTRSNQRQQHIAASNKGNWRQKHEDFINTIRAAKAVTVAQKTGGPLPPPPPPSINPDYVQCPYCQRRFNETAAERHINFCKEQHNRLPKNKADATAKARQNARLQYKAPKLKSKQSPTSPGSAGGYGYGGHNMTTPTSSKPGSGRPASGRSGHQKTLTGSKSSPLGGYGTSSCYGMSGGNARDAGSPASGRALRTGRTAEMYTEARQLSAKQRAGMPNKSSRYSPGSYTTPSPPGSGYGRAKNGNPDGYNHMKVVGAGKPGSGSAKFCHECGTKYPVPHAKFCCECGMKRVNIQ